MAYFTEVAQIFQKCIWNCKILLIATAVLRKKNKVGGITIPDIKLYNKGIIIKTSLVLAQEQAYISTEERAQK